MVIVGIDVGLSGALAFLDPSNPSTVEIFDIPVHLLARGGKAKREIDIVELIRLLAARRITHAFVEQVSSMPGQGLSSTFAFGKGFGIVLGVLASHSIPMTLIPPATWKRALGVPAAKDGARARASQLLPQCAGQWALKKNAEPRRP
jgi:crossover junction endodeoxyribonuclease RuvC